jgi:hypothetical protein
MYPVLPHITWEERREPRFGPLFLDSRFHDGQLRLSWSARSTLSSNNFELLATSF